MTGQGSVGLSWGSSALDSPHSLFWEEPKGPPTWVATKRTIQLKWELSRPRNRDQAHPGTWNCHSQRPPGQEWAEVKVLGTLPSHPGPRPLELCP